MSCSETTDAGSALVGAMVCASAGDAPGGSTVSVTPADIEMGAEGGSIGGVCNVLVTLCWATSGVDAALSGLALIVLFVAGLAAVRGDAEPCCAEASVLVGAEPALLAPPSPQAAMTSVLLNITKNTGDFI
ncbi:hypothetical protein GCM10027093_05160 [Paraburkholderia jirisanensis]